jgi:ribosomal protein S14
MKNYHPYMIKAGITAYKTTKAMNPKLFDVSTADPNTPFTRRPVLLPFLCKSKGKAKGAPFKIKPTTLPKGKVTKDKELAGVKFNLSYIGSHKTILAKSSSLASDQKRRSAFEHRELNRRLLKCVLGSNTVLDPWSVNGRFGIDTKTQLSRLALVKKARAKIRVKKGTLTTVRNRCVVSGTSSTLAKHGFGRICFRNLAGIGLIPGLKKI